MTWQPKRGERVIAVLPDGHEIEGVLGWSDGYFHRVYFDHLDGSFMARVRTVKPVPVPVEEPTAFGACVKDRYGVRWVRDGGVDWLDANNNDCTWRTLTEARGPITIVNADPFADPFDRYTKKSQLPVGSVIRIGQYRLAVKFDDVESEGYNWRWLNSGAMVDPDDVHKATWDIVSIPREDLSLPTES